VGLYSDVFNAIVSMINRYTILIVEVDLVYIDWETNSYNIK
jgi:hypothetical protein